MNVRLHIVIACFVLIGVGFSAWAQEKTADRPIYLAEQTEAQEAVQTPATRPAGPPDVKIIINIPATTMTLYENGQPKIRSKVSVGTGIYPTPEDHMYINHIVWNPWWIPPPSDWAKDEEKTPPGPGNPLGLIKIPMQRGYMLHGTNARSSVGRAASHGCMRMYNQDAAALGWYLQTHFSNKTDPSLRERYSKQRTTSFQVNLNQRIPVDIIYDPVDVIDGELMLFPDYYGKVRRRRFNIIIDALVNHGIKRDSIDDNHVRIHANNWPQLETRIPLHRVINSTKADRILALPAVDNRVRFFH